MSPQTLSSWIWEDHWAVGHEATATFFETENRGHEDPLVETVSWLVTRGVLLSHKRCWSFAKSGHNKVKNCIWYLKYTMQGDPSVGYVLPVESFPWFFSARFGSSRWQRCSSFASCCSLGVLEAWLGPKSPKWFSALEGFWKHILGLK